MNLKAFYRLKKSRLRPMAKQTFLQRDIAAFWSMTFQQDLSE